MEEQRKTRPTSLRLDPNPGRDGHDTPNSDDSERDRNESNNPRKKRLSAFELSAIVVEKGITTVTELQALASEQKSEGKTDLAEFIVNRAPRVVSDIVKTAWHIENADAILQRSQKSRMVLLEEAGEGDCVGGCDDQWRLCAEEILENNGIHIELFRTAVKEIIIARPRQKPKSATDRAHNCGK